MTTRRLWSVAALMVLAALSQRPAFAQGDGPRTHWKEMLTNTNLFSLTYLHASGKTNPLDPAHTIVPGTDFDVDLTLLGYSRSFSLFDRTAVASILLLSGEIEGEVAGPVSTQQSSNSFGDPLLAFDVNLFGAPAMPRNADLLRYEPDFTVDLTLSLAIPIGEYDDDVATNLGQNRWFGRIGLPTMVNLGDWVPGRKTTLEFLPAIWFFEDNDDFLGRTAENDPMVQLEGHLTRDFTETMWGSLDAVWYSGAESTIAGVKGEKLDELSAGFTLGYQINHNLMLTAGYVATLDDGRGDLDLGVFRINLIYGWHELFEGIKRLGE